MDGFLLIDKPTGISSFGVVAKVRYQLKGITGEKVKVGHTGTLDPAASGLLILVTGKYTKRAAEFSKMDKTYKVELTLGSTSTTADSEGEITKKSTHRPSEADIKAALHKFVGQINQMPPIFSAIKVDGQRAYKLARAGKPVELRARPIQIYSINEVKYNYPKLSFLAEVSSGTYIRSLAEDIGKELGSGAYLSALRRTKVGNYDVKGAVPIERLTIDSFSTIV